MGCAVSTSTLHEIKDTATPSPHLGSVAKKYSPKSKSDPEHKSTSHHIETKPGLHNEPKRGLMVTNVNTLDKNTLHVPSLLVTGTPFSFPLLQTISPEKQEFKINLEGIDKGSDGGPNGEFNGEFNGFGTQKDSVVKNFLVVPLSATRSDLSNSSSFRSTPSTHRDLAPSTYRDPLTNPDSNMSTYRNPLPSINVSSTTNHDVTILPSTLIPTSAVPPTIIASSFIPSAVPPTLVVKKNHTPPPLKEAETHFPTLSIPQSFDRYKEIITVPAEFQENEIPDVKWQIYRKHHRIMSQSKSIIAATASTTAAATTANGLQQYMQPTGQTQSQGGQGQNGPALVYDTSNSASVSASVSSANGSASVSQVTSKPTTADPQNASNMQGENGVQGTLQTQQPPVVTPGLLRRLSAPHNAMANLNNNHSGGHHFDFVFAHYSDGICIIDPSGKIQYCNKALSQIFLENNLPGKHISYLIPQNYYNFDKTKIIKSKKENGESGAVAIDDVGDPLLSSQCHEYQTFNFQGGMLFVSVSFGPFQCLPSDEYYSFIVGFRDITETRLLQQECHEEQKKNEQLIRNMLPDKIVDRINNGEQHICDDHANVTVGFCDIVQFTKYCTQHKSSDVVLLLNSLFTYFDKIAQYHGVTKIETIGDAYMIACGIFGEQKHSQKCVMFMLDALQFAKAKMNIEMRAGLAAGPLSSGIIGHKKPHFSLFGENVCKAARLEAAGQPMRVHVTESILWNLFYPSKEKEMQQKEGVTHGTKDNSAKDNAEHKTTWTNDSIKHLLTENKCSELIIVENGLQLLKGLEPFPSFLIAYGPKRSLNTSS